MALRSRPIPVHLAGGTPTVAGLPDLAYIDNDTGKMYYRADGDTGWVQIVGSISGVAAGYKVARGSTALGGSNPTAVTTGLTTILAFTPNLQGTTAPGLGTSALTVGAKTGGSVDVYAWKPTGVSDPTLIASTGTETFDWIAVGV